MREITGNLELENDIAREIMHISRCMLRRCAREMESLGIGVGQLPVLQMLMENGAMTQRQIADGIRVTPATVSGTIKRMERSGLIHRTVDAEDARVFHVSLTEDGTRRAGEALAAMQLPYGDIFEGFDEAERRQVLSFVIRMGENLKRTMEAPEGERADEDR